MSNRSDRGRDVRGDRFHTLRIPGVSGMEMKVYETTTTTNVIENWKITNYITFPPERSLQVLLFSGSRLRVLSRLASLAQIGELARRQSLARCIFPLPSFFINCFIAHFILLFLIFLACVAGVERNFLCECNSIRIAQNILRTRHGWKDIYLMTLLLSNLLGLSKSYSSGYG